MPIFKASIDFAYRIGIGIVSYFLSFYNLCNDAVVPLSSMTAHFQIKPNILNISMIFVVLADWALYRHWQDYGYIRNTHLKYTKTPNEVPCYIV